MQRPEFVEDYLDSVIPEKISLKTQSELREELESHIYDRADFYIEIGYDEETALKKAVEQMGETESVKRNFNALYYDSTSKAIFLFSGICIWNLLAIIAAWGYMNFVDPIMYSLPSVAVLAVFLAVFVFLVVYTIKCKRQNLRKQHIGIVAAFVLISLGSFITSGIFFPIINAGKLVVRYVTTFPGDGSDLDIYFANIIAVILFTVLSFIAYDKGGAFRKKPYRLSLKQITAILSVLCLCFLVLYGFAFAKYEWWYNQEKITETSEKEYCSFISAEQWKLYDGIEERSYISETEKSLTEKGFVKQKSYEDFIESYIFPYSTQELLEERIASSGGSGYSIFSYTHTMDNEDEYDDIISCILVSYNENGEIIYKLFIPDMDIDYSGCYLNYNDGYETREWCGNLRKGENCEEALNFIRGTGARVIEDKNFKGENSESKYNIYLECYHPFNPDFIDFLFNRYEDVSYSYRIEIISENGIIADYKVLTE
ncbi:MAG: hypothetical protein IJF20_05595 [Clostridia bacterium]|nr:hypothetical protein [Clostridia bacterium]